MKWVVDNPCFICICAIHLAIPQMIDQCTVGEAVVEAQRREAMSEYVGDLEYADDGCD